MRDRRDERFAYIVEIGKAKDEQLTPIIETRTE
jgi:hypothetical protein